MSDVVMSTRQAALDSTEHLADQQAAAPAWLLHLKVAALSAFGVLLSCCLGVLLYLR